MFSAQERQLLLSTAHLSIEHGLEGMQPLRPDLLTFPLALVEQRATFVTLEINQQLRGCIGSLEAHRPLIIDIAENAFRAAFQDPRFPPLGQEEYPLLQIHLSILDVPKPIQCHSEAQLLEQLVPGQDGLILQDGSRRATFLPSVWDMLPEPGEFLKHLRRKAGLPDHGWSPKLTFQRYHVELITE
jgi:AmmeMemoRadiSam system protein A